MGGRGGSSGIGSWRDRLNDSTSFNTFLQSNMSNPDFKSFGQENGIGAVRELWYNTRIAAEQKNIHEMSKADAVDMVRDAIPQNVRDGWFRDADSAYKPKVMEAIVSHPGAYNAGLNIAYQNYRDSNPSNPISFQKWANTPQTLYRGDRGQQTVSSDIFSSYTPDRSVAKSFGSNITSIRVKPIDTWGSYQTTGEQEFLIPRRRRR